MHTRLCAYAVVWRPEVNFGHLLLLPTSSSNQGCSPNLELADSLSRVASEPLGICRCCAHLVVPTSNPAGVTCFCAKLGCWDLKGELHVCAGSTPPTESSPWPHPILRQFQGIFYGQSVGCYYMLIPELVTLGCLSRGRETAYTSITQLREK